MIDLDLVNSVLDKTYQDASLVNSLQYSIVTRAIITIQCVFLARILQKAKVAASRLISEKQTESTVSFRIGVIGCGQVGKELVTELLAAGFKPHQIAISTRRPATLQKFISLGIRCCFDNKWLVSSGADIVFLCCLPAHVNAVCSDIRNSIHGRTMLCSVCVGYNDKKLIDTFQYALCTHTVIHRSQVEKLLALKLNTSPRPASAEDIIRICYPGVNPKDTSFLDNLYKCLLQLYIIETELPLVSSVKVLLEGLFGESDYKIQPSFVRSLEKRLSFGEYDITLEYLIKNCDKTVPQVMHMFYNTYNATMRPLATSLLSLSNASTPLAIQTPPPPPPIQQQQQQQQQQR